jgi:3-hydroxyisobutyrate dehydrogenase-like beta-hydroxyacid dehydrogenase
MARKIIEAGFPVTLYARRAASLDPFADTSANPVQSLSELGGASDIVGICVVNDAQVEEVLTSDGGLLAGMQPGGVVLVHSTIHPDTCVRLAKEATQYGVALLDAPVSGGGEGAERRQLVVMVGGDETTFQRCQPVFATYAGLVVHLGGVGAGQYAKIVNNLIFYAQSALVHDGFTLAGLFGLDLEALATVLKNSSARSAALDFYLHHGEPATDECVAALRQRMGDLLTKDVHLALELADPDRPPLASLAGAAERAVDVFGRASTAG